MKDEKLGTISCPSGSLVLVDFGLMGGWSKQVAASVRRVLARGAGVDDSIEDGNVVALSGLPTTPLAVFGARIGRGRWAKLWQHLEVRLSSAPVAKTEEVGELHVERARLMFADPSVLDAWEHESTLDGLADIVFWGRDAELLAEASGATKLFDDTWGVVDLPIEEAKLKYAELGELCGANDWFVRAEPREHDHHHLLLKAAGASPNRVGELELSSARLFGAMLDHGDGAFPVVRCLDARGGLVTVRVILGTPEALETLDLVNPE